VGGRGKEIERGWTWKKGDKKWDVEKVKRRLTGWAR